MNLSKQALLVAGMHRSGTSALTRVLSLLGADLPENIAPAIPGNNETGFWESVDLMILHDELLGSAGSFWDDWTEFNVHWYQSAAAQRFRQRILGILQNDFDDSVLFTVKDPRVCRFLPFWLSILDEMDIDPYIVIPVRNPLEVAESLRKRDGFPLAQGGLIWLRHVLDAVHHSRSESRAFVGYEDLMNDWRGVVDNISRQAGVAFPRRSVLSELEVEKYLDQKQKHNHASLQQLKACREFSPLVTQVYEHLLALLANPDQPDILLGLEVLREQFNQDSYLFAKVLQAREQLAQKEMTDAKASLSQQMKERETQSRQLLSDYEQRLSEQSQSYEQRLSEQSQSHEQRLSEQSQDHRQQVVNLREEYAHDLLDQLGAVEQQLKQQRDEYARIVQDHELQLEQMSADFQHSQHQWYEQSRVALQKQGIAERHASRLRVQIIHLLEDNDPSLHRVSALFDGVAYLKQYPDVRAAGQDPLEHFLSVGGVEGRQPHVLFDVAWYRQTYQDVAQAGVNPLLHYLDHGAGELRQPHPLFLSEYYVRQYPDALSAGLAPLTHYVKYGADWGFQPHPLFDPVYYQRQLREDVPAGMSLLAHFLLHKRVWRLSPSPCFDSDWYLDRYPDVLESGINPLMHYVLYGAQDDRKPHPKADNLEFKRQYADLFQQAGIPFVVPEEQAVASQENHSHSPALSTVPVKTARLVNDPRFTHMMDFPETAMNPDSTVFTENQLTIHWVTCDFARQGGGGNMTIFRFIRLFELFGHRQHIWLHNKVTHTQSTSAYEDMVRNYQQTSAQIHFVNDAEPDFKQASGDIIIATDWESVWPVLSVPAFKRRFYFVQDHEPSFFAAGGHSLAAEMTYHEELDCICAGPWLEKLMQERYGRWATKFWLAADQQVYFPAGQPVNNTVPRVAFYARVSTSRRAVELGLLALDHLAGQGVHFHVDVYGSDDNADRLRQARFAYTDHGVLNADELGELYRQCDVGMVFSATNYSLVPQEMMACGLAVLEMDGDNTRTVFPEGCVVLARPHPREIAKRLGELLVDAEQRSIIAAAGCRWARQFDWESTARDVSVAIQQRLQDLGFEREARQDNEPPKVSVVIPVLNGGDLLLTVLAAVHAQKTPWPFEVLVIDSGSTDGSLEALLMDERTQLHSIPKAEFSHGGTRNLGVELTAGEYIAFLTQDALPVDEFWLFHLVSALEHDPAVAGAFGRHLPYPEASPFVKRDLTAHFEGLGKFPLYLSRDTERERFDSGEPGWRQILHFYSDNNSCLRRSVWEKIPYPVIEYGEDQVWADLIIKAGYKKAYAINALVYHSHDYNEQETFERSRTEAAFFRQCFGYEMLVDAGAVDARLKAANDRDRHYADELNIAKDTLERQLDLNAAQLRGYYEVAVQHAL